MRGERTGKGGKGKKGGEAMPTNMLKVAFLCTFAYGVHYSLVDLNYHYHKN